MIYDDEVDDNSGDTGCSVCDAKGFQQCWCSFCDIHTSSKLIDGECVYCVNADLYEETVAE